VTFFNSLGKKEREVKRGGITNCLLTKYYGTEEDSQKKKKKERKEKKKKKKKKKKQSEGKSYHYIKKRRKGSNWGIIMTVTVEFREKKRDTIYSGRRKIKGTFKGRD